MGLVLLLDAAQDLDRVLDRGLTDEDLLEPPLEGGVLLDPLAVLVERGRADHVELAAREHRLEHVAGVHRGVAAGARADDGVELVDERDDLPAGVLDLLEHGLEPLLELAAVLRAGHHGGQVEAEDAATLEGVGDVAGDDPLRESFDDGGLAHTGLADQHRVVLGPTRQHLHHATNFGVPADHRVEPAVTRGVGQVDAVLLQRLVRRLGVLAGDAAVPPHGRQPVAQSVGGQAGRGQHVPRRRLHRGDRDQEVLGGDVLVLHRRRQVDAGGEHPGQCRGGARLLDGAAAGARERVSDLLRVRGQRRAVDAGRAHQCARGAVLLPQQRGEQVDRLGGGVARGRRGQLRRLDRLPAARGELLGSELAQGAPSWSLCLRPAGTSCPLPRPHASQRSQS